MSAHVAEQSDFHRQGLVQGLILAEIMLMLVFCFLIATATVLRREKNEVAQTKTLLADQQAENEIILASMTVLKQEAALAEKPVTPESRNSARIQNDDALIERDEGSSLLKRSSKENEAASIAPFGQTSNDAEKASRNAEIVASVERLLPEEQRLLLSPQSVSDLIVSTKNAPRDGDNPWPPIIILSEAQDYTFKTGSAELMPWFRKELMTSTLDKMLSIIEKYDVDVIEVVGHTDEQAYRPRRTSPDVRAPAIPRSSNLDRNLITALKSGGDVGKLTPVDNAGLGLARAVSVVRVLRQSPKLAGYKMNPLSGGQLINTNDTLALNDSTGDVPQRRRIEIRLRKSSPRDTGEFISLLSPARPLGKKFLRAQSR